MDPIVDLVVLIRQDEPLHPEVEQGLREQAGVQLVVHRVVGKSNPGDSCRWDAIARARNQGKMCGNAPWLMYLDDNVVLSPGCILTLIEELDQSPVNAALAADYLGEFQNGIISHHVSMGATLFRREALEQIHSTWREKKCECQCCCDDLRRSHWGIDYCSAAKAMHLPQGEIRKHSIAGRTEKVKPENVKSIKHDRPGSPYAPSVCLVVCYFGPFPDWIDHFLLSCAYNPTIDFLIFSDQDDFPNSPPNVHFKRLSSSSFNKLATQKIGVPIRLGNPRKLCDFKPAYGHLFEELLEGWNYWGYTDLDVIYGDLRKFLSAANLQEYDVFTARKEYFGWSLYLFRNNSRLTTLYRHSNDFRSTLQFDEVLSFDECGKQWREPIQGDPFGGSAKCDSMTHVVRRLMADQTISACFSPAVVEWPDLTDTGWRLRWQTGKLWYFDQNREAMYFHFHAFKKQHGYRIPSQIAGDPIFEMTPKGIEAPHGRTKLNENRATPNRETCDFMPTKQTCDRSTDFYTVAKLH